MFSAGGLTFWSSRERHEKKDSYRNRRSSQTLSLRVSPHPTASGHPTGLDCLCHDGRMYAVAAKIARFFASVVFFL